jgi:hypothetical protein
MPRSAASARTALTKPSLPSSTKAGSAPVSTTRNPSFSQNVLPARPGGMPVPPQKSNPAQGAEWALGGAWCGIGENRGAVAGLDCGRGKGEG